MESTTPKKKLKNNHFPHIGEMIENKTLYNELKQNARKRIVDNYEQKVVWNAILEEYKKLENNI